jgi:hypothetical protein
MQQLQRVLRGRQRALAVASLHLKYRLIPVQNPVRGLPGLLAEDIARLQALMRRPMLSAPACPWTLLYDSESQIREAVAASNAVIDDSLRELPEGERALRAMLVEMRERVIVP